MEYVIPLGCSSGKGRKCTLYFYYTKQWTFINLSLMESTETWRDMVSPPVPCNPEKLVQKQYNLQVSIGFRHQGGSEEWGSETPWKWAGRRQNSPSTHCGHAWCQVCDIMISFRTTRAPEESPGNHFLQMGQPVLMVSEPGICSQAWMTLEFKLFLLHHIVTPRRGSWGWHSGVG